MNSSFQKRYWGFYLFFAAVGIYPPYFGDIVQSKLIRVFFRLYSYVPVTMAVTHTIGMYIFFLLEDTPSTLFWLLFRRSFAFQNASIKYLSATCRLKSLQKLFQFWNDDVNERKQEILMKKMHKSYKYLIICGIGAVILPQLYGLTFILDPNGPQTNLAWYPHAPNHPLHLYFGLLHSLLMMVCCFASFAHDSICLHLLLLLSSQYQLLRESLSQIIPGNSAHSAARWEESDRNTEDHIGKWVKEHQRTLSWAHDISQHFALEISNKFSFVLIYTCLMAFATPYYLKTGNFSSLGVSVCFGLGTLSFQFYLTRVAGDVTQESASVFDDAYGQSWYTDDIEVQKNLLLISTYSKRRPVQFCAFKIFPDDPRGFLEMLIIAYRCLSVLLQVSTD